MSSADAKNDEAFERLHDQLKREHEADVPMMTNRSVILGTRDPTMLGARLLENGLRYGAVLGIAAATPFFYGATLAFDRATKIQSGATSNATAYDRLYARFLIHYGLFVAAPLGDAHEPASATHLVTALSSLTMAFTDVVRHATTAVPETFRTPEFSSYALTVLSLVRVAQVMNVPIEREAVESIVEIRLQRPHDRLRRALAALISGETAAGEQELREAFRATFNAKSCVGGLIANLQFTHAYACSLASSRGQRLKALTELLRDSR